MAYPIQERAQILNKLMPGWSGCVDAQCGFAITWRDARPQPTEKEIDAAYQAQMAAVKSQNDRRASLIASLAALDLTQPLSASQAEQAVRALIELLNF